MDMHTGELHSGTIDRKKELLKVIPIDTVGYIGAPLVDGQNLEGADLAPLAIRMAGIQKLIEKLGWKFMDYGDMDFSGRYEELGIRRKRARHTRSHWQKWMDSGSHDSFAEWAKVNVPEVKGLDVDGHESHGPIVGDPHDHVVNAHLIGPAIELVYKSALEIVKKGHLLLTIGGDHSIATGTLGALSVRYPDLCVIWIDAHGDANTPDTSPSLHYHGMPAAHAMGWFRRNPKGFEWMGETKKYVDESHLAYIGLRDLDIQEATLLRNSDCHISTMRDVDKYGIARVIEQALIRIDPNRNRPIHVTLDIDAVDPQFAPGTGTCARGGLTYREVHYICEEVAMTKRLVGMDLVEINPGIDQAVPTGESTAGSDGAAMHGDDHDMQKTTPTVKLGVELILSALGRNIMPSAGGPRRDGSSWHA